MTCQCGCGKTPKTTAHYAQGHSPRSQTQLDALRRHREGRLTPALSVRKVLWSQRVRGHEIASKLGITQAMASYLLNGKTEYMSTKNATKLLEAFPPLGREQALRRLATVQDAARWWERTMSGRNEDPWGRKSFMEAMRLKGPSVKDCITMARRDPRVRKRVETKLWRMGGYTS